MAVAYRIAAFEWRKDVINFENTTQNDLIHTEDNEKALQWALQWLGAIESTMLKSIIEPVSCLGMSIKHLDNNKNGFIKLLWSMHLYIHSSTCNWCLSRFCLEDSEIHDSVSTFDFKWVFCFLQRARNGELLDICSVLETVWLNLV